MNYLWLTPLYFQGLIILWDDLYFHRKRGLPFFERWGHPLDTISYLAALLFPYYNLPTNLNQIVFAAIALFSTVFITKDEFLHFKLCGSTEMWIHAMAFSLHPICLGIVGYVWIQSPQQYQQTSLFIIAPIFIFLFYQVIYWNFIWQKKS